MVDVGELIEGDIVRAFFGGGSLVVVWEEVIQFVCEYATNFITRGLGIFE